MRKGIISQNPAATHDGGLTEQVEMALQGHAFAVPRQKQGAHQQGVKSATQEKRHADSIVLHRLFLGKVVAA